VTRPRELLDQLDALRAAATPGEWRHEHNDYGDEWWFGGETRGGEEVINDQIVTGADHSADAELIVAAVNALPRLTAALHAVLDLHEPAYTYGGQLVCIGCSDPTPGGVLVPYPCADVRAITAVLTPADTTGGAS
jgi:hypothetical protein